MARSKKASKLFWATLAGVFVLTLAGCFQFPAKTGESFDSEKVTSAQPQEVAQVDAAAGVYDSGGQAIRWTTGPFAGMTRDQILAAARTYVPRDLEAGKAHEQGHFMLLGANGELVAPGPLPKTGAAVPHSGFVLDIVPRNGALELWMAGFGRPVYAVIGRDGSITYSPGAMDKLAQVLAVECLPGPVTSVTAGGKKALSRAAPTHWPFKNELGEPCPPPLGSILAAPPTGPLPPPPPGANGWVMLGVMDYILAPVRGAQRPENVMWVIPLADGGFQLAHSGPVHRGVYLTVHGDGKLELGEGAGTVDRAKIPNVDWAFRRWGGGQLLMVPPGYGAPIWGSDSRKRCRMLIKDDHIYSVSGEDNITY